MADAQDDFEEQERPEAGDLAADAAGESTDGVQDAVDAVEPTGAPVPEEIQESGESSGEPGEPGEPGETDAGEAIEVGEAGETTADAAGLDATEASAGDGEAAGNPAVEDVAAGDERLVGSAEIKAIIEALIFASPEPLSLKQIQKLLDSEPKEDVAEAVAQLKTDYERQCGLQLVEVAGGYQIVTRPDLNDWVRRLFHERSTQKLSVQALESLAVIAYRQPITAAEITEIRGVNTSGVINTLLERHLVKIVGRKAVVGRPFMYATTREFLIRFGLNDITDLPKVQDMVDALGLESPLLVERVTSDEQLPLDEPDNDPGPAPTPAPTDD